MPRAEEHYVSHDETTPLLPSRPPPPRHNDWNSDEGAKEQNDQPRSSSSTLQSIIIGLGIGALFCHINVYFGLHNGFSDGLSQEAVLLGFGILQSAKMVLGTSFGPAETVLITAIAGAMGMMPSVTGLVSSLAAVELLLPDSEHIGSWTLSSPTLILWGLGVGLFALPMTMMFRKYFVDQAGLPWPSAKAAGTLVRALHGTSEKITEDAIAPQSKSNEFEGGCERGTNDGEIPSDASRIEADKNDFGPRVLLYTFAIASALTSLASIFPILKNVPILGSDIAAMHYWSFNVSPGVFGQGMMTGPTMTSHMLVGAIVGWGILLPLARSQGWIIDAYSDWESTKPGWTSWIALSILVADSVVELGWLLYNKIDTKALRKLYTARSDRPTGGEDQHPLLDRWPNSEKSSNRWPMNDLVLSGMTIAATMACAGIATWSFDGRVLISTTIVAVCLSLFLSIASVRVIAMGDRHPVGGLARFSQFLIAILMSRLSPDHLLINLVLGAIVHAGITQMDCMIYNFKIASVVGTSPILQLSGHPIGAVFGSILSALFIKSYTRLNMVSGGKAGIPAAREWLAMANSIYTEGLPPFCLEFSFAFASVFALVAVLRIKYADRPWIKFLPGGVAFAIGMYTTPASTLPRFAGAMAFWYAKNRLGVSQKIGPFMASGLNLGESIVGLLALIIPR